MTRLCVMKTETMTKDLQLKGQLNGHPHGEYLSAYLDGMLNVAKTRAMAEHLRACASCRQLAEQLQETKMRLRTMPPSPPPGPEFWTNAYRRLRIDDRERTVSRRMPWDALRGPGHVAERRWAAGLAAAAALGMMVAGPLTLVRPPSPPVSPSVTLSAAPQDSTPDVSALVESHTDSVSRLPLADTDRQKMIAADAQPGADAPEAVANADVPF